MQARNFLFKISILFLKVFHLLNDKPAFVLNAGFVYYYVFKHMSPSHSAALYCFNQF